LPARTNTLQIRTPEGVTFSLQLAGPVTRCLACAVDLACVSVASNAAGTILGLLGVVSVDLAAGFTILAYFLISIGYGVVLEWYWRGQTLGKRLLRLQVVDEEGLRIRFSQIAIRNLLRFVDMLPGYYLVGGVACLVSRRAQRLGDFAASTVVVRHPVVREPDLEELLAEKYNSFRDYPHLQARLRQATSPAEAGLAVAALVRRNELDPPARVRLFAQVTDHFRDIVTFPEESTQGLTDEQYVRNVVDTVFRAGRGKKIAGASQRDGRGSIP
jgi:uncharacterized RDD family membrane protein YckC